MHELDEYIERVKHLPPAPRVLPQLLGLLGQIDTDCQYVVDLVSVDTALTAAVLQVCNSAYFAGATPADDLTEAINRLGFRQVYRVVAAVSGSRSLSLHAKIKGLDAECFWQHSVATAIAAQLVAGECGGDQDLAFTSGLLHDIGKMVLAESLEHIYGKLLEEADTGRQTITAAENKLLGVNHADIGGRLLERWKFPENLVAGVSRHHCPLQAGEHVKLASQVYIADMIVHFLGMEHGGSFPLDMSQRNECLQVLGLRLDSVPPLMIQVYETYHALIMQFRV